MYVFALILVFIPQIQSANILALFSFPSLSHQIVFQAIYKELSLRGHSLTVVTTNPLNNPILNNLTEIDISQGYQVLNNTNIQEDMSLEKNPFLMLYQHFKFLDKLGETELQKINITSKQFDVMFVETSNPVMYAWERGTGIPIVGVSSLGAWAHNHAIIGNPAFPVTYPDFFLAASQTTFTARVQRVLYNFWARFHHFFFVLSRADQIARKYIGEIPYLGEIEQRMSLLFVNTNPVIYPPRPTVPAFIELGQLHIRKPQKLPGDLRKILDEAPSGVIYMSLGSNVKSVLLPENNLEILIETFKELQYTVLWKYENGSFPGKPKNVIMRKWLPQQDILRHPKIKVFITQGGLQSIEEAITGEVPIIGMPFMSDQSMNIWRAVEWGIGLKIDPSTLTKTQFKSCILKVIKNFSEFKKRIKYVRQVMYDKPMNNIDKAIFWSGYVVRHKGANFLKSPSADISWWDFLMLDIITVFFFVSVIFFMKRKLTD